LTFSWKKEKGSKEKGKSNKNYAFRIKIKSHNSREFLDLMIHHNPNLKT